MGKTGMELPTFWLEDNCSTPQPQPPTFTGAVRASMSWPMRRWPADWRSPTFSLVHDLYTLNETMKWLVQFCLRQNDPSQKVKSSQGRTFFKILRFESSVAKCLFMHFSLARSRKWFPNIWYHMVGFIKNWKRRKLLHAFLRNDFWKFWAKKIFVLRFKLKIGIKS